MPDPGIRIHLRQIASWKALRTNEREALLAAIARIDALEDGMRSIINLESFGWYPSDREEAYSAAKRIAQELMRDA